LTQKDFDLLQSVTRELGHGLEDSPDILDNDRYNSDFFGFIANGVEQWGKFVFPGVILILEKKDGKFIKVPEKSYDSSVNIKKQDGGNLEAVGGIDFRQLPVVSEKSDGANKTALPGPLISMAELDSEWDRISNAVAGGNIPSGEKLRQYALSCLQKEDFNQRRGHLLACAVNILQLTEDYGLSCEPGFLSLFYVLEKDLPARDYQVALAAINFS
jgi:hypothetical protein